MNYGLLLSHAYEARVLPTLTAADAIDYGDVIADAQPGIEYELMHREDVNGEWLSTLGETAHQVIARRWA